MFNNRQEYERSFWEDKTTLPIDELEEKYICDPFVTYDLCHNAIIPHINGAKTILELGCGIGRLTVPFANCMPESQFYALDISPGMIRIAEAHAAARAERNNINFIVGDGRTLLGLPKFDAVYSMMVFQHIDEQGVRDYIRQVGKHLRHGGIFRFQFVIGTEREPLSHHYSVSEMRDWLREAGMEVTYLQQGLIFPNWGWIAAQKAVI